MTRETTDRCQPVCGAADPRHSALAALHRACFSTSRPWSAEEFADLLAAPEVVFCGDADGFALGRAVAGEAELLTIAVAPSLRRRGHGRALLRRFEAAAARAGARDAFLEVAADNASARALYRAAGWEMRGTRPRYYRRPDGTAVDAAILGKRLAPGD